MNSGSEDRDCSRTGFVVFEAILFRACDYLYKSMYMFIHGFYGRVNKTPHYYTRML